MTIRRALALALTAAAALPAAAHAQLQIPPPRGDNIADAIPMGSLSPSPSVVGFDADTTNYTTEPNEPTTCRGSVSGKTIWATFTTPRYGRIDVTAAGYDAVIGLAAAGRSGGPDFNISTCIDRLAGRIESFPRDSLPIVAKGQKYFLVVGGARDANGQFPGGQLEVAVELLSPEVVVGDAILTWVTGSGGVKAKSVRVDGPPGSTIDVFCARKSCGKHQVFSVRKTVFNEKLGRIDPGVRPSTPSPKAKPVRSAGEALQAAARTTFKNRKLPNGARLFVAVTAPGEIGEFFYWDVKKNAAGTKQLGCLEPGTNKPKRLGTCNGA